MAKFRTVEQHAKDCGTFKTATRIALSGGRKSALRFEGTWTPYCDDPVTVYRAIRPGGEMKSVECTFLAPCRKCEKCLLMRQLQWAGRIEREIAAAPRSWWVTLTMDPSYLGLLRAQAGSDVAKLDKLAYKDVQKYLDRLRKERKAKFRYIAVFELGDETGRPHYHLILHEKEKPILKRRIDEQWPSIVHARLVDLERKGLAGYLAKYATKSHSAVQIRASTRYGQISPVPSPPKKSLQDFLGGLMPWERGGLRRKGEEVSKENNVADEQSASNPLS